jgi:hypothetical protein
MTQEHAHVEDAPPSIDPNPDRSAVPQPESGSRRRDHDELGIRTAASAARKALFFVELLRGTEGQAGRAGSPRSRGPARAMAERLQVAGDVEHCRQQIARIVATVPSAAVELRLRGEWRAIEALISEGSTTAPLSQLDQAFTGFLHRAIPPFYRRFDDAVTLAKRNLATTLGMLALLALLLMVEQMRSLLFDQWGYTLWTLVILSPVAFMPWLTQRWRKTDRELGPISRSWAVTNLFWCTDARHPLGYDVFSCNSPIARQLMFGALTKAVCFLGWLLACAGFFAVAYADVRVLQTIAWVVCLFGAAGTALALLDFWDFLDPAPVRFLFLLIGVVMTMLYAATDFSWVTVASVCTLAVTYIAFVLWRRSQGWQSLAGTMTVVAMLGTIAMWSADRTEAEQAWRAPSSAVSVQSLRTGSSSSGAAETVSDRLEWPYGGDTGAPVVVIAASGGGSRAAVLTALTLQRLAQICVPGSSGGPDQCEKIADHLHAISSVSGGSLATAAYLSARLGGKHNDKSDLDDLDDKVADDFLQPVLRGALTPGVDRGAQLEKYWDAQLGLGRSLSEIGERWKDAPRTSHPPLPLPIFNSATLDAHAVVLTPLDWSYCVNSEDLPPEEGKSRYDGLDDPTWIYYRSSIYSLGQLLPGFDPTLAQAVRASANFPFGFPVVQVATTERLPFNIIASDRKKGDKPRVALTDGGVVSNSGMWTLYKLLDKHSTELKERGLILVIVDGSKMPEYSGRTRTWDLLDAIGAQPPIAANLHAMMIEALREKLGKRLSVSVVGLDPITDNNVYTSWALDRGALGKLKENSAASLAALEQNVSSDWLTLETPGQEIASWPARLPVD